MATVNKSHAYKAAEALKGLEATALSAAQVTSSFYDMPVPKQTSGVEDNNEAIDGIKEKDYGMENRIAVLETTLSELSTSRNEDSSEIMALRGELSGLQVENRIAVLETTLSELSSSRNEDSSEIMALRGELGALQVEKRIAVLENTLSELSTARNEDSSEIMALHGERGALQVSLGSVQKELQQQSHTLQEQSHTLQEQSHTLQEQNDLVLDQKRYIDRLEKQVNKQYQGFAQNMEESLEQVASDLLLHLGNEIAKRKTAHTRLHEKLLLCWNDAKETTLAEKRRMDIITERLSQLNADGQQIFEDQLLTTVQTMGSLKRALEDQMHEIEQQLYTARKERSRMVKDANKYEERVESLDREHTLSSQLISQANKQAWEAAGLATNAKEDVKKMERKISTLMGAVNQSRESTMMALSHMRNVNQSGGSGMGVVSKFEKG
jgi:chromosome segregation ATPase